MHDQDRIAMYKLDRSYRAPLVPPCQEKHATFDEKSLVRWHKCRERNLCAWKNGIIIKKRNAVQTMVNNSRMNPQEFFPRVPRTQFIARPIFSSPVAHSRFVSSSSRQQLRARALSNRFTCLKELYCTEVNASEKSIFATEDAPYLVSKICISVNRL